MSASSEPIPQGSGDAVVTAEDTNRPCALDDRTLPNGGARPLSLPLRAPRAIVFRPSEYAGDLGRLGRYRVLKPLGKGGMGAVFLGFDERLRRKVALKVMLPDTAEDPQSRERFLREARAAAQITHDNVIAIHEADEADGIPYIAMQYLKGYSLDEYLAKKGRPSFAQVVRIGREIALGLAAAHKLGLVHRDIKPSNIWLEAPNGRVKILDFGLARPARTGDGELTHSGMVVGTPAYMPPEQARGLKVDGRADLFSLGVVLYRLIANALPFDGPDVMAIFTALAVEEPRPILEHDPNTPVPLAALIHELLAKKPALRPQTADEVSARLHALDGPPIPAADGLKPIVYVPLPVTMNGAGSNAFEGIVLDEAPESSRRAPRPSENRPLIFFAAGIALILTGAAILLTLFGGTARDAKTVDDRPTRKAPEPAKPGRKPGATERRSIPKLDPDWVKTVSALPPAELLGPLNQELIRRNPDYDGRGLFWTNDPLTGTRTALALKSDLISDLTALLAVPNLESLALLGAGIEPSPLSDLAPLQGLKKLRCLQLDGHPQLRDLTPLQNLPIEMLVARNCAVDSLEPLRGLPLRTLEIPRQPVTDFGPLAKLPLRSLTFGHPDIASDLAPLAGCPLEQLRIEAGPGMNLAPIRLCPLRSLTMIATAQPDLSPLESSPLEEFTAPDPIQYESFIRQMPKIRSIGGVQTDPVPRDEYLRDCDRHRADQAALVQSLRQLPTLERIDAVRAHFQKINGGPFSILSATIENGEVTEVDFTGSDPSSACADLGYLNAFPRLRSVTLPDNFVAPLFHCLLDLPIESVTIAESALNFESNLHAFARMKSLKVINGEPFESFAKRWHLFPARAN